MPMKMDDILEVIRGLAKSQGIYGRTYAELITIREEDQPQWDEIVKDWESKNFETPLDFIKWFEGDEDAVEDTGTEDLNDVVDIIDKKVQIYERSDYSESVYIYNDIAYVGETGYQNMVEQIREDYNIMEEK